MSDCVWMFYDVHTIKTTKLTLINTKAVCLSHLHTLLSQSSIHNNDRQLSHACVRVQ